MADELDIFNNAELFRTALDTAKAVASSELIPAHIRGKVPDVLMAIDLAKRLGLPPLLVLRNIYSAKGNTGWKTEFLVALARRQGFELEYEVSGEGTVKGETQRDGRNVVIDYPDIAVRCDLTRDGKTRRGEKVSMRQAIAAGWTRNEQYTHSAEHMLRLRAAAFAIRLLEPGLLMGLPTSEEIEGMKPEVYTAEYNPTTKCPAPSTLETIQEEAKCLPKEVRTQLKARLGKPIKSLTSDEQGKFLAEIRTERCRLAAVAAAARSTPAAVAAACTRACIAYDSESGPDFAPHGEATLQHFLELLDASSDPTEAGS